ncbi:MucR family transcriptional regulator [Neokomagataea anthophila]|uniref:MucR family transcriptional regulator n=1 Tax=Neokomagataea anthophila TaxID=2826925 RepID=A0ABS5E744_9PROT|nr:MucR family transcriptional regulator [Neokomagataea anthophila]MBR0559737.1 MucR family transcriptional regulator [Neokomagataea anthophila]
MYFGDFKPPQKEQNDKLTDAELTRLATELVSNYTKTRPLEPHDFFRFFQEVKKMLASGQTVELTQQAPKQIEASAPEPAEKPKSQKPKEPKPEAPKQGYDIKNHKIDAHGFRIITTKNGEKSAKKIIDWDKTTPAIPVSESVFDDKIICLEDGVEKVMLKRYLWTEYGLTPQEYRERWNLPANYPMATKNNSDKKKETATKSGFGRNKEETAEEQTDETNTEA